MSSRFDEILINKTKYTAIKALVESFLILVFPKGKLLGYTNFKLDLSAFCRETLSNETVVKSKAFTPEVGFKVE